MRFWGWTQMRQVVQGRGLYLGRNWEPLESLEEKTGCDVCFKGILVAAVLTLGCREARAG